VARANPFKYPILLFLILIGGAAWPVSASALIAPTAGGGKVGYLPLNQTPGPLGGSPLAVHATEPTGLPPLEYHGGPVMHSQEAFAVFWVPSGYSFPAGYEEAIETYLEDVAADSGKPSNVYSVSAQYTDEAGHATYNDSYGGSLVDTDAYGETCPEYSGLLGASYTACITDERMQEELTSVVEAEALPHGLGVEYYIVLPPEVGSCFEEEGGEFACFDTEFCAYHNFIEGPELVYSNISYSPEDPLACGVEQYPNGHSNGNADDTFSSLSHEANESITDPTLEAWYDKKGFENGDECRNTKFGEDYGPALGGSSGALFNEAINSDHYYLQQEWSNDIGDCAQRVGPPQVVITAPSSAEVGETVSFEAGNSIPGDGEISGYEWEFGDGSQGEGPEIAHSYSVAGTYTVKLTLTDDGGFTYSKTRPITVNNPEEPPEEEPSEEEPPGGGSGGSGGGGSGGTVTSSSSSSSSSPSVPSAPLPTPRAGIAIAATKAKVKGGVVAVRLACNGGPCFGVIKLMDHGVIGHAAFHLAAGAKAVIKVRLSTKGLALLAKKPGSLDIALSGRGVRPRIVTLSS
jgi:hypothetical protein